MLSRQVEHIPTQTAQMPITNITFTIPWSILTKGATNLFLRPQHIHPPIVVTNQKNYHFVLTIKS